MNVPEYLVATSGCDSMIHIYDLETLQTKKTYPIKKLSQSTPSIDGVTCLSNFNSHSFVFGCKTDKSIRVFNLEQLHNQPVTFILPQVHKNYIRSIQCLPLTNEDKKLILSAGDDKQINISKFDTDGYNGFLVSQFPKKHTHGITCLSIAKQNNIVYSSSYDSQIMSWDITSQQHLQTLPLLHKDWIRYLLSFQQNLLLSCGDEPCINVFDLSTNKSVASLQDHSSYIYQIHILQAPHLLLSCSEDKTLKIWDIRKWKCVTTVKTSKEVYSLQVLLSHGQQEEKIKVYSLTESGNVNVWQHQSSIDELEKVMKHDLIPLQSFDSEQITQNDRWSRNLLLV